jgi:hypothetical protein
MIDIKYESTICLGYVIRDTTQQLRFQKPAYNASTQL